MHDENDFGKSDAAAVGPIATDDNNENAKHTKSRSAQQSRHEITAPSSIGSQRRVSVVAEHVHVANAVAGIAHAPSATLCLHIAINWEGSAVVCGGLDEIHAGRRVALHDRHVDGGQSETSDRQLPRNMRVRNTDGG